MNRLRLIERRMHRSFGQTWAILLSLVLAALTDLISLGSSIDALRPDLALLVVFYWNVRQRYPTSIGTAWCFGLLRDIATLTPLGLNAGLYCITAWAGVRIRKRMDALSVRAELTVVLLVMLAGSMLSWCVGLLLGSRPLPETHLVGPLIGTLIWPAVRVTLGALSMGHRRSARED